MTCPICHSGGTQTLTGLRDDRFGYPGKFALMTCGRCNHRWLDWKDARQAIGTLYTDYYPRSDRVSDDVHPPRERGRVRRWWRGDRSSAMFWVPRQVRVLDIGCGFGESLAYHRSRGCDAYGVEADRNVAAVAAKNGFNVEIGLFDPQKYQSGFFDYVTMNQVIEHVIDPVETLRGIRQVLRPSGVAILTTPNISSASARLFGRTWINWHTPFHLHFYSPESLRLAARAAGLELVEIRTITSSEWLSYQWINLVTRPALGVSSVFWTRRRGRAWEKGAILALRAAHRLGVDHALTRLCDLSGRGDNYVVQLRRSTTDRLG